MSGYVDPDLTPPRDARERALFAAVRERGLSLRRVRPGSTAVRLTGPGVDLMAVSLAWLRKEDIPDGHRKPT